MSNFFVIPQYASLRGKLVLKTVIYYSKLLGFQNFASLKLEHYNSDSRLYGQTLLTGFLWLVGINYPKLYSIYFRMKQNYIFQIHKKYIEY